MPHYYQTHWGSRSVLVWLTTLGWSGFLLGTVLATAAVAEPSRGVALHDGKLSVHMVSTPLRQVLAEVSRLSLADVVWLSPEGQDERISVEFTDLPLVEGLQRL